MRESKRLCIKIVLGMSQAVQQHVEKQGRRKLPILCARVGRSCMKILKFQIGKKAQSLKNGHLYRTDRT